MLVKVLKEGIGVPSFFLYVTFGQSGLQVCHGNVCGITSGTVYIVNQVINMREFVLVLLIL